MFFPVCSVCGRAWPLEPLTDQQLGGIVTWIPAAMMSLLGVLVVLRYLLRGIPHTRGHLFSTLGLAGRARFSIGRPDRHRPRGRRRRPTLVC